MPFSKQLRALTLAVCLCAPTAAQLPKAVQEISSFCGITLLAYPVGIATAAIRDARTHEGTRERILSHLPRLGKLILPVMLGVEYIRTPNNSKDAKFVVKWVSRALASVPIYEVRAERYFGTRAFWLLALIASNRQLPIEVRTSAIRALRAAALAQLSMNSDWGFSCAVDYLFKVLKSAGSPSLISEAARGIKKCDEESRVCPLVAGAVETRMLETLLERVDEDVRLAILRILLRQPV